jgi:hypothetical protein
LLAGTAVIGASLALATGAQAQTVINVQLAGEVGTWCERFGRCCGKRPSCGR